MGTIVHHEGRFFIWSSVVDAPITCLMTRAEMRAYLLVEYGRSSADESERRLHRAEAKGTSSNRGITIDDLIVGNRAGDGETEASWPEILAQIEDRSDFVLPSIAARIAWVSESVGLPKIGERILLASPRQTGEIWDLATARMLCRHEDVAPQPVPAGCRWPTDYYWGRDGDRNGGSILITGNSWWARLDEIPLPPGAEHARGPILGEHYVRQIGRVFIEQGPR